MKTVTPTNTHTLLSTNDVPVLMDVLVEKRLTHQSNRPNQTASLSSQLANQLSELRKENATLQMKNQKVQRYAERVQADRDEFRKQVIRLLQRSKLLEQQLEEHHKPKWNETFSLEIIKNKIPGIKVIKNYCSSLLQTIYTIVLQKKNHIKKIIVKRNSQRLESHTDVSDVSGTSDKKTRDKRRHDSKKETIKHDYIKI